VWSTRKGGGKDYCRRRDGGMLSVVVEGEVSNAGRRTEEKEQNKQLECASDGTGWMAEKTYNLGV